MDTVRRLWRGELALADAFWNWAVFGGLIVNGVTSALFLFLIMGDRPVAAVIAGYAPSLPYNVLVSVGVLRSAARYDGDRKWGALACITTLAGMILLSLT
jgi:peptidoglycan biosynthesis protein MviN/MurJ (putative lipid II flippase)